MLFSLTARDAAKEPPCLPLWIVRALVWSGRTCDDSRHLDWRTWLRPSSHRCTLRCGDFSAAHLGPGSLRETRITSWHVWIPPVTLPWESQQIKNDSSGNKIEAISHDSSIVLLKMVNRFKPEGSCEAFVQFNKSSTTTRYQGRNF